MFYSSDSPAQKIDVLKAKIPYEFKDEKHLRSAVGEHGLLHDFGHLETIGDSLINMVVKTTLGIENPSWSSGQITQRSQEFLRNTLGHSGMESVLCQIAEEVGLKEYFGYNALYKGGKGLALTHASAVEALVGAVFYDSENNFEVVRKFVLRLYQNFGLVRDKVATVAESDAVAMQLDTVTNTNQK